jgi:hypothetical protein
MTAALPTPDLAVGADVIASVVTADGLADVAGRITRLDGGCTFVRLVGFLPAGYRAGDVFPLSPDRVRAVSTATVVRHRDGLVWFDGAAL